MTSKTKLEAVLTSMIVNLYPFAVKSVRKTADELEAEDDITALELLDRCLLATQRALCAIHRVRA